jgi:hypothetical protein
MLSDQQSRGLVAAVSGGTVIVMFSDGSISVRQDRRHHATSDLGVTGY